MSSVVDRYKKIKTSESVTNINSLDRYRAVKTVENANNTLSLVNDYINKKKYNDTDTDAHIYKIQEIKRAYNILNSYSLSLGKQLKGYEENNLSLKKIEDILSSLRGEPPLLKTAEIPLSERINNMIMRNIEIKKKKGETLSLKEIEALKKAKENPIEPKVTLSDLEKIYKNAEQHHKEQIAISALKPSDGNSEVTIKVRNDWYNAGYNYYSAFPSAEAKTTNPHKETYGDKFKSNVDWVYEYINDIDNTRKEIEGKCRADGGYSKFEKYKHLEKREIGIYNYLYENKGKREAEKFLNFLESDLDERLTTEIANQNYNFTKNNFFTGVVGSALSVPISVASSVEHIGNTIDYALTGNFKRNKSAAVSAAMRKAVTDSVDWEIKNFDVFDFVYNTTMSGADSVLAAQLGNIGGAVVLGLSAAASTSNDIISRGGSSEQAFVGGVVSGLAEGFFEKFSIGQLNAMKESQDKGIRAFADNLTKSMFTNASEETATEIANLIYDYAANRGISQYSTLIQQYMQDGLSEHEAREKASKDMLNQVLEAGLSGMLMGAGFAGVDTVTKAVGNYIHRQFEKRSFSKQVDNVIEGKHNPILDLYVSETPEIYTNLGFTDSALLMRNSKINEILEKHPDMSVKAIKQIPEAVKNPLLVLKSKTHPTESVVAITNINTDKGNMVIPIWVNQSGNYVDIELGENIKTDTNFVASAYGRNIKALLEYANENDGFLYQSDKIKEVKQLLERNGLQLPTPLKLSDSDITVPQKALGVNTIISDSEQNNADLHLGDDSDIISNNSINDVRSEGSGKQEPLYNGSQWVGSEGTDTERRTGTVQEADGGVFGNTQKNWRKQTGGENLRDSRDNRRLTLEQEEGLKESVVKNEDGTPKTVYHFTDNMEFDTFGEGDIGFHFGSMMQAEKRKDDLKRKNMLKGEGRYIGAHLDIKNPVKVSSDIMVWHAAQTAMRLCSDGVISQNDYLKIEEMQVASGGTYNSPAAVELRRILAEQGYDGIVYPNLFEGEGESYIAFYPEQVIVIDDGKSNSQSTVNEERESGFRSPSDKDIYRDPTKQEKLEELSDERKNAKQRHITDIAKKLDSDLKIAWVDRNSPKLNGKNGKYVREINTIYLAKDMSVAEMYVEVFKHEFIHRLESRGTYKAFKDYLINKSVAFEQYVRAQLKIINGEIFKGSRAEAIKALTDHYYNTFKNDKTLGKPIRDKFTFEGAEREIVADFGGEVLFKGSKNRKNIAQALADEDMLTIGNIESSMDALEELAKTDRSLFQKLWDIIRDFIENLKGIAQNKSLVEDLEYIEQRLARVYDSRDTKKAAEQSGGIKYSTGLTFREQLEQIEADTFDKEHSHLFVRADTPEIYLNLKDKKIPNLPIVMSYDNATISMFDNTKTTKSSHNHGLGIDAMSEIPQYMEKPSYIVLLKNGRINALLTQTDKKGRNFFISLELEVEKPVNEEYSGGYKGKQHLLLTAFGASKNYFEKILNDSDNKILYDETKNSESRGNPESNGLNIINDSESIDIIDENTPTVKNNISTDFENYSEDSQFSVGSPMQIARENLIKYENGELTREQYLEENERLWGEAIEKYGSIEEGEDADAPIATPKAVGEGKLTERFVRTIIETGKLTDETLENIEEKVLVGDFSYKPVSDEAAMQTADTAIKNGTAEDIWQNTVATGKRINKNRIAIGERLLSDAIENGDTKRVIEISSELADVFTRAGQVVQAARLLKKMTGAGRLVSAQRMVKTLNKDLAEKYGEGRPPIKISRDAAERLVNAKTPKGIEHAYQEMLQHIADQIPANWLDKWNALRYFLMLSNSRTHIRNLVGNAIFMPMIRIKNVIAYSAESIAVKGGKLESDKRTKQLVIKKEYADFAKNDSNDKRVKELLKGNKYNDKTIIREKQRVFKTEALNFLTDFNSSLLESEDMLFKNKHYIHALAGFLQSRNADLKNISEELLFEARIYAVKEAKIATFNDENILSDYIQQFSNKNTLTNVFVEGLLPFKRTPINIVRRGIEYSPIGLGIAITKGIYDVKKGKITVTEYIDGLASGITGTGIMLIGMFLANLGIVVGGMKDDDESTFEKLMGKQEYSVEILGKSYTIDWAAPSVIPFFIGAEIVNTMRSGEEFNLADVGNIIWNSLEPITELSMLSGIQSVIESTKYADNSQMVASIIGNALTSYAMQGIPAVSGAIARTIDPVKRSWYIDKNSKWFDSFTQSVWNNVSSKIPFLNFTQIPKINAWGEEVKRGNAAERLAENFISPGYYSEVDYNDINNELLRLGKATGEDVYPKTAAKFFSVNGETKLLTANEYVTYAKAKGQYSHDYIDEFMSEKSYQKLTDEEKSKVIKKLYEYANAKAKTTVSDYDLMNRYKTVTNWEKNGDSAVDYYIAQALKD